MKFEIDIGGELVEASTPTIPMVFRHHEMYLRACGDGDDSKFDAWSVGAIMAAAVGLCWAGDDLGVESLRSHGDWRQEETWVDYGDTVMDALIRRYGIEVKISKIGGAVMGAMMRSIPTPEEVEEERVPFAKLEEVSTKSSFSSA